MLALALVPAAAGAWAAAGTGAGASRATSLGAGGQPLAVAVLASVSLSWSAGPVPGTGYVVRRYDAVTGAASAVGGTCTGTVAGASCTDTSVPLGTWRYGVTPVLRGWTGSQGSLSIAVTVAL